jgi:hypothetical protein
MNFVEADRTPEYELNEIVWKSVRGADSPMPPPVRAGFIKVIDDDDDHDEPADADADGEDRPHRPATQPARTAAPKPRK